MILSHSIGRTLKNFYVLHNADGSFQVKKTTEGSSLSARSFYKLMELMPNRLSKEFALTFLDKKIIFCRTFQEDLESLELILCQLKEIGL